MQNTTRYVLSLLSMFVLIVILTQILAYLHLYQWHNVSSGWIGTAEQWSIITGFIEASLFIIPLGLTIFFPAPKKYYAMISLLGLTFIVFFSNILGFLVMYMPIALCGWLLGEGILWLYNKLKK